MIPLSIPQLNGNEWKYIKECLDTTWVSSAGKYVYLFEQRIATYTGTKHAVACVNGTSALQVSLRLAGVAPGDEVIVPTLTFIAPINAVAYNGASPIFMDVDKYYNLDIEKTIEFIRTETVFNGGNTYNKESGKRISAIVPVHIWGNGVWLDELVPLCLERNIAVVEDASESLGTVYNLGKYTGRHTGTIGRLGCLSFNGNKIITAGGGGMILTDDEEMAHKARYLTTQAKDDEERYIHKEIGYNFRLTNIQAALGVAQLEQLPNFLKIKENNYEIYKIHINNIPGLNFAESPDYANNNHWMYPLRIDNNIYGRNREELMKKLSENNIQTRPVWYLNHLQKPYKYCQNYKIEKATELWENTLNIPCSVGLTDAQINEVLSALKKG